MTRYLLDSDVLMDFFKQRNYATALIKKLITEDEILTVSILSIAELRAGWTQHQAKILLPKLYNLVNVLNLDKHIAETAGQLRQEYKNRGVSLPTVDTLIAATAILEECQLVTRNKKDYPMPEVKFYPTEN